MKERHCFVLYCYFYTVTIYYINVINYTYCSDTHVFLYIFVPPFLWVRCKMSFQKWMLFVKTSRPCSRNNLLTQLLSLVTFYGRDRLLCLGDSKTQYFFQVQSPWWNRNSCLYRLWKSLCFKTDQQRHIKSKRR